MKGLSAPIAVAARLSPKKIIATEKYPILVTTVMVTSFLVLRRKKCIIPTVCLSICRSVGQSVRPSVRPKKHIDKITGDTYQLLRNITMAFKYLDEEMSKKLITSLIRPKLEYAAVIWSPHKKKDIKKLERRQRAATKIIPSLRDLPYEENFFRMKLPTLAKRKERGDFIAVYKVSKGLEKI